MSGINWADTDTVLASQLMIISALVVHLLILRPRAARQDLLLDARIVQDELDLAVRLGHIAETSVEIIAVQQLLRRIQQNTRSTGLALERIPALAQATQAATSRAEAEYVSGALDRLSDAGQRYLRGAWPRAGVLSTTTAPVRRQFIDVDLDLDDRVEHAEASDHANYADRTDPDGRLFDPRSRFQIEPDSEDFEDPDRLDAEEEPSARPSATAPFDTEIDLDLTSDLAMEMTSDPTSDLDEEPEPDQDVEDGAWAAIDDQARPASRDAFAPPPATVDLSDPTWAPAWMDLVLAENPEPAEKSTPSERHARPFRPSRSSGPAATRKAERLERLDRSSVLPR